MSKSKRKYINKVVLTLVLIGIALSALFIILKIKNKAFNSEVINSDHVIEHISALTSEKYQGRLTGTQENRQALLYIKQHFERFGIEGGGEDGGYFQSFSTIIPQVETSPVFTIPKQKTNAYENLIMYDDYVALTSFNGGSVDYQGDVLLVGSNLLRIDPQMIEGKVVVIEGDAINPKWINYVIENNGAGIICCADTSLYGGNHFFERQKSTSIAGKTGESIFVAYISKERYLDLIELAGGKLSKDKSNPSVVQNIRIKVTIDYPIVDSANIIGRIQGNEKSDRILMITANVDGLGQGVNKKYFPGANNQTSGLGLMMELARTLSLQESLPYKHIVFIGFNGSLQENAGADYYINHPIYPLEQTTLIHLDDVGQASVEGLSLESDNMVSKILKDKIHHYAMDANIPLNQGMDGGEITRAFVNQGVPAVMFHDGSRQLNTYDDTVDKISQKTISQVASILANYLQHELYHDNRMDYLSKSEGFIVFISFVIVMFNILLEIIYKRYPAKIIFGQSIEYHYYRLFFVWIRKVLAIILPILFVSFMLAFLVHIDKNTDIQRINGEWTSNFSFYLSFKQSLLYLRSIFDFNLQEDYTVANVFDLIYNSSVLSIKLISASLALSVFIGIIRGMIEGYRSKKGSIPSFGTLVFFSIPDVLIVLLGVVSYTYIAKNFPQVKESLALKEFIFPLITLSIIPTVYISRITFLTILEELEKEYVRAAKALGYSKIKIFTSEILPAVAFKVVDSLPTIMTMLLSNMIIVEYLFNYNGIVYYLLYLYKRQDVYRFVPMALTLGLIYSGFVFGIGLLAKGINPLKREVKR